MTDSDDWHAGLQKLLQMRPPLDFTGPRAFVWHQLVTNADAFLQQWEERARQLGWTALDVFGANRLAPYARIDHAGLVVLLSSDAVIGLTERTAIIRCRDGNENRFYRRPPSVEQVAVWELFS